jgi:aquaporin Z
MGSDVPNSELAIGEFMDHGTSVHANSEFGTSEPCRPSESLMSRIRHHGPEYAIEAAGLGLFMISACGFAMLLFHPSSAIAGSIALPLVRRILMGLAMGSTAIALVYSPWGKRSGAHFNPAVTWTFVRLGKVTAADAIGYTTAQVLGGLLGVVLMSALFSVWLADPSVNYVATVPGLPGTMGMLLAWLTEFVISFLLMSLVLDVSNRPSIARWTGVFAGSLVALNISLVAPLSGMSMNPARTLASGLPSGIWTGWWIYFTAPPLAMLWAAQVYVWRNGRRAIFCAKLHHQNDQRCIFCESRRA